MYWTQAYHSKEFLSKCFTGTTSQGSEQCAPQFIRKLRRLVLLRHLGVCNKTFLGSLLHVPYCLWSCPGVNADSVKMCCLISCTWQTGINYGAIDRNSLFMPMIMKVHTIPTLITDIKICCLAKTGWNCTYIRQLNLQVKITLIFTTYHKLMLTFYLWLCIELIPPIIMLSKSATMSLTMDDVFPKSPRYCETHWSKALIINLWLFCSIRHKMVVFWWFTMQKMLITVEKWWDLFIQAWGISWSIFC